MMVDGKSATTETQSKNKLRPKWSTVWMHCTDLKNGRAVCNLCNAILAYHSHISTSTYNLKRHLRLKHPTLGLSRRKRPFGVPKYHPVRQDGHKRSSVWDHCTIIGEHKVKCDLCDAELVYLNASTHNLKRHLETRHTTEELRSGSSEVDRPAAVETTLTTTCNKVVLCSAIAVALASDNAPLPTPPLTVLTDTDSDFEFIKHKPTLSGAKQRNYDQALLEFIALDFHPVSIVNDIGFRDFVSQLQPAYILPRRQTIRDRMLPLRFERQWNRRRIEMQEATAVCLTIEGWMSSSQRRYFSVVGHYLGPELDTKMWLLDCFEYKDQDTITHLKDELMHVTEEWQIQEKIVAVVTDNIGEILTAVELIGWTRLPCFTHTLNAISNEALAEIDEILIKIRTIVEYFRCNAEASTMLRSVLQHMNLAEVDLMQDVSPHWTSTYQMMHRFQELRDPIINTLSLLNAPCLQLLSWSDWDIIARACDLLMALYEAAIEISAEKFMCASKAVVMVKGLLRLCTNHIGTPGQVPTIEKMASVMMSSLSNWFGNMELNPLLAEAMLLDPRFKTSGFTDNSAAELAIRSITEAASREVVKPEPVKPLQKSVEASENSVTTKSPSTKSAQQSSVWDEYDQQVSDMLTSSNSYTTLGLSATNGSIQSSLSDQRMSSVWSDYDQKVSGIVSVDCPNAEAAAKQIERFLQEPPLSRQENCLEWWRNRTAVYPRLLPVVRERLCIVATSISSDNIFTTTGLLLNDRRRTLNPCEVRHSVFLNANLHL